MAGNKVKVSPEQLEAAVKDAVSKYISGVTLGVNESVTKVAKATKKKIVADSPVRAGPVKPRGRKGQINRRYKKDWIITKEEGLFARSETISNRQYRITHLLEDGHALRQGGRTRAQPHIRKHREAAIREFQELCEEVIKDGR